MDEVENLLNDGEDDIDTNGKQTLPIPTASDLNSLTLAINNPSYQQIGKGLSFLTATVFIIGEVAGGGILTLPKAVAGAGWAGIALIIVCCANAGVAGIALAKCWLILEERWPEYRTGLTRKPFASIGYRAYGNWMSITVSVAMNVTRFGASTVFLLLTANLIKAVTQSAQILPNMTHCVWIPIVAVALTPLSWLGSPADFWPAAYSAMISTVVGSILLVINLLRESPQHIHNATYSAPSFVSFFMAFGNILFAYGGASAFPNFQNDMREREKFPKAVLYGFSGLLFLYVPVSVCGYVIFGDSVTPNILNSMQNGWFTTLIDTCFAVHCFFAFLIILNPVLLEVEEFINIPKEFGWKRCLIRLSMMAAITFTGVSVPDFGRILDLIGGSTVALMAFIMPPMFYFKLCSDRTEQRWPQRTIPLYLKIYLAQIALVGALGGVASTYSSIDDWITSSNLTLPCYIKCQ